MQVKNTVKYSDDIGGRLIRVKTAWERRLGQDVNWGIIAKKLGRAEPWIYKVLDGTIKTIRQAPLSKLEILEAELGISTEVRIKEDSGTPPAKTYQTAPDALLLELSAMRRDLDNLALRFVALEDALKKKYQLEDK